MKPGVKIQRLTRFFSVSRARKGDGSAFPPITSDPVPKSCWKLRVRWVLSGGSRWEGVLVAPRKSCTTVIGYPGSARKCVLYAAK